MSVVLDASMAIAWFFDDERTPVSDNVLAQVAAEGAFVPSLWRLEVANMLRSAVRRDRCGEAYERDCLGRLARLRIVTDAETDAHAWARTRELAVKYVLTTYDAAYVELAARRRLPLATRDAAMAAAAKKLRLDVLFD
jgi:predicted nucleic acid-binding protein